MPNKVHPKIFRYIEVKSHSQVQKPKNPSNSIFIDQGHINQVFIPFSKRHSIDVRLFIDHSIHELFLNEGKQCTTHRPEALHDLNTLEFRGNESVNDLHIYKMKDLSIEEELYHVYYFIFLLKSISHRQILTNPLFYCNHIH